jgi:prepilin-type N-terminal cleavage/methylation domain-containing protein
MTPRHPIKTDGRPWAIIPRRGMTLIEMLVAMTLTLIMMGAVAQIFGMLGQGVGSSRAITELTERMRVVGYRLRQDLRGATASLTTIGRPELAQGYFEIIEGPNSDELAFYGSGQFLQKSEPDGGPSLVAYQATMDSDDRLTGDTDDLLMLTTRADSGDFQGKLGPVGIRSPYAEVIWYCTPTPNASNPISYTLHRRQRIVKSHPGTGDFVTENRRKFVSWAELNAYTDVSCRFEGGFAHPNSLGDLTKRENRFLHQAVFPHRFDGSALIAMLADEATGDRFGDDAILTNVIGFDVRVYDPGAPVQVRTPAGITGSPQPPPVAVMPGDPGYIRRPTDSAPPSPFAMTGAFVDLGYGIDQNDGKVRSPLLPTTVAPQPLFYGAGDRASAMSATLATARAYCTWSSHYESNFIDEDGVYGPDQGLNGLDDDANGLIDDPPERETAPPYALNLRGLEVRVRCYEPASRKVRQMTIRHAFQ